ncbi:MAG: hypothetical protein ACYDEP_10015 [Acidimicrobiales bacterium]
MTQLEHDPSYLDERAVARLGENSYRESPGQLLFGANPAHSRLGV